MQFQRNYIDAGAGTYDCASCTRKGIKCLQFEQSITLRGEQVKNFTGKDLIENVTRDNIREILGSKRFLGRCIDCQVCPKPLFSEKAKHLYGLYNMLNGLSGNRTPDDIYRLPAIYVEACNVINGEWNRIERFRKQQRENK